MTFLSLLHNRFFATKALFFFVVIVCLSQSCLANSLSTVGLNTNTANVKLWQKANLTQNQNTSNNVLEEGTFVGYSHNFSKNLGVDLSVDSYVYTNKSDNSFAWVVGFVSEVFKLNYHIDQKAKNQYLEVVTHYPLSESLSLTGYAGNQQDGSDVYRDYSVGLAFALTTSVNISAGIADRELKTSDAEGNVFFNINGIF